MLPLTQYSLLEDSESVLLPTDTGTQEGTSNRVTEAPTAEHDDDNSLGYTADSSRKTEREPLRCFCRRKDVPLKAEDVREGMQEVWEVER
ncbi:hypothetical protein DPX16_6231 [Anabarilius grahami]|uniref:Uncharacterized protein n=1 Tax=Anabarilius grahami TaxID=495550 RepID=A0A3N0XD07_ANAGA|nr:hypothetical protein DPX16_6231 [Anabarilius grahami]